MLQNLSFTVPGEPRGKARHRTTKSGFTYTPQQTVEYENLVRLSFTDAYPNWIPTEKEVDVIITAYYQIPKSFSKKKRELALGDMVHPMKKPDVDNIAKSILDSLNQIAFVDDKQVVACTIYKAYSEKPRVEVQITLQKEESKNG